MIREHSHADGGELTRVTQNYPCTSKNQAKIYNKQMTDDLKETIKAFLKV